MHQPILQTWWSVIRLQRQPNPRGRCASASSAALVFSSGSWRSSLQIAPNFANWSDDSGWAGGGRVWVGRGGKVPEEPLAFTLAPLVQVVLLVPLLACSLVVVVLLQVPHRWPAVLLKVLLVLCIRTICLRDGKGCNVFQDKPWHMLLHFTFSIWWLYYMHLLRLKSTLCIRLEKVLWEIRLSSTFRILLILY